MTTTFVDFDQLLQENPKLLYKDRYKVVNICLLRVCHHLNEIYGKNYQNIINKIKFKIWRILKSTIKNITCSNQRKPHSHLFILQSTKKKCCAKNIDDLLINNLKNGNTNIIDNIMNEINNYGSSIRFDPIESNQIHKKQLNPIKYNSTNSNLDRLNSLDECYDCDSIHSIELSSLSTPDEINDNIYENKKLLGYIKKINEEFEKIDQHINNIYFKLSDASKKDESIQIIRLENTLANLCKTNQKLKNIKINRDSSI